MTCLIFLFDGLLKSIKFSCDLSAGYAFDVRAYQEFILFVQLQTSKKTFVSFQRGNECGGHFVVKSRSEFDQATEQELLKQLTTVSLDGEGFQGVKLLSCTIAGKFASTM